MKNAFNPGLILLSMSVMPEGNFDINVQTLKAAKN